MVHADVWVALHISRKRWFERQRVQTVAGGSEALQERGAQVLQHPLETKRKEEKERKREKKKERKRERERERERETEGEREKERKRDKNLSNQIHRRLYVHV